MCYTNKALLTEPQVDDHAGAEERPEHPAGVHLGRCQNVPSDAAAGGEVIRAVCSRSRPCLLRGLSIDDHILSLLSPPFFSRAPLSSLLPKPTPRCRQSGSMAGRQRRCVTAIASSLPSPRRSSRVHLSSLLLNTSLAAWQDGSGDASPRCGMDSPSSVSPPSPSVCESQA